MKTFRQKQLLLSLSLLVAATGFFVLSSASQAQTLIKIDGSSTVFPISEAMAEAFREKNAGVKFTIGIAGTGGGFKKFCQGETDISDASRPILKKEMVECAKNGVKYIELPVAFDALTVVVNPRNAFLKQISAEELKTLWAPAAQAKVMSWNQVNASWPKHPVKLYGPGADSGTFDYFTEAINGKAKQSRTDYNSSEDDNVIVQAVSRDVNAMAYVGFAYYLENRKKLKAIPVVATGAKAAVLPSIQSVSDASYQPLARPLFIYINAKSLERPEVNSFVSYYLNQANQVTKQVKYIPLTKKDYQHTIVNFQNKKLGTAFGGEAEVGVTIEELLKREPKQ